MSEVVVVVTLRAQAGREQEMSAVLTAGSEATHAEDGCLIYAMHQRVDDPAEFAIVECWASQKHLDAHLGLAKVKDMIATIDGLADGQPAFGVYRTLLAGDPGKGSLALGG
jgi:quinol monooxygenase YgiN